MIGRALLCAALLWLNQPVLVQDDEVALTALRSRDAFGRAMNVAARQMGAISDGNLSEGNWRSGIIKHTVFFSIRGRRASLTFTAIVTARFRGESPDSVRAAFRAQVSADVPLNPTERSDVARAFLVELVTRTNRSLAADTGP